MRRRRERSSRAGAPERTRRPRVGSATRSKAGRSEPPPRPRCSVTSEPTCRARQWMYRAGALHDADSSRTDEAGLLSLTPDRRFQQRDAVKPLPVLLSITAALILSSAKKQPLSGLGFRHPRRSRPTSIHFLRIPRTQYITAVNTICVLMLSSTMWNRHFTTARRAGRMNGVCSTLGTVGRRQGGRKSRRFQ